MPDSTSRQHVGRLVESGLPTDSRGRVKIANALRWVEQNLVSQAASSGSDDAAALIAARVRLTRAQAQLAETANRQKDGELIERALVARALLVFSRLQRDTILQFAARSGPELAADLGVDTRVMVSALDAAMRNLLIEVSRHKPPYKTELNDAA